MLSSRQIMKIRKKPNVMASCQTEIDAVTHTHTHNTHNTHIERTSLPIWAAGFGQLFLWFIASELNSLTRLSSRSQEQRHNFRQEKEKPVSFQGWMEV